MAYQTNSANSIDDLLDKFRLFAISQGWTVNRWVVAGNGHELCIEKAGAFYNFRSYIDESVNINGDEDPNKYGIALNGSDGYSAGANWDEQPGYPVRGYVNNGDMCHSWVPFVLNLGAIPTYHFFAPDSKSLYCEVEEVTGKFLRFGCGSLDLFNSSAPGGGRFFHGTGGAHVTNSSSHNAWLGADADHSSYALEMVPFRMASYYPSYSTFRSGSYVRAQFSAFDNWAMSGGDQYPAQMTGMASQGTNCLERQMLEFSDNMLNSASMLFPCIVGLNIGDEYISPIGILPGFRILNIKNFEAGDEFTLGSDTWKVFPWYEKGGIGYNRGVAYLKN